VPTSASQPRKSISDQRSTSSRRYFSILPGNDAASSTAAPWYFWPRFLSHSFLSSAPSSCSVEPVSVNSIVRDDS
jgi:hypothetical protein